MLHWLSRRAGYNSMGRDVSQAGCEAVRKDENQKGNGFGTFP